MTGVQTCALPICANPGFGTRSSARSLPYTQDAKDVPGPGAYNQPVMKGGDASSNGHGSSFKSGTQRLQVEEVDQGDPGAYDAYANSGLAANAAASFGRANRSGNGAFGATSAREMKLDLLGEGTPGPGSYDAKKAQGLFDKMPSSSFRSSSTQRAKTRNEDTPGVGSYQPSMSSVEPSSNNAGSSMRGRGARFKTEASTTDADVGPGAYESHMDGSLATTVAKSVERMSRSNPGFGSRQPARELPYQKDQADMPGPGAYDSKLDRKDRKSVV